MRKLILAALALLCMAVLGRTQNKIAHRPVGQTVVAFSATPTFDAGVANSFKITLTGNVTSSTVVGMEAGQQLTFEVCQDGVGGRTFAWPGITVGPIAILSGINVCTVEVFHYDGTSATIYTTTTAGGGGSGTVNNGTGKCFTWYTATGTTVSNNCNLDDGLTTANTLTYSQAGGIAAKQFVSTAPGGFTLAGSEGTCSGAAANVDVLCGGDATSHSIQISNNGDSFRTAATHESTSPPQFGVLMAGTFPQIHASPVGILGQPFLSAGPGGYGGYGPLDASCGANCFLNRFPKTNLLTSVLYNDQVNTGTGAFTLDASASTGINSIRVPNIAGATATANGAISYDTTSNNFHFGMNTADAIIGLFTSVPADSRCLHTVVVSGNVKIAPMTGDCSVPGGAGALSGLTAATAPNSINNGDFAQTWNASLTTAGKHWFTITENTASVATGAPYLLDVHSIPSSTAAPLIVTAGGTANGIQVDTTGTVKKLGTGGVDTGALSGIVAVANGGLNNNATPSTDGQLPIWNQAAAKYIPGDPIVSFNFANLQNASTATGTLTSSATRVSTFSQYGTLYVTWASITGSPSGCTIQVKSGDSLGNFLSNGSAISVSPANGTTSQTFTPAAALTTAAQMQSVFACSVYPSTGTLSLEFVPSITVNVPNTVAISAASLPLPSGASTSAKQPALGTAGSASSDVITVQGITSMTPLKVDGGGVTQPVSGTVTANVGTTNGLALDATLTGGTAKVQGNVASGSSDSGNPLKVGGIFNNPQPTVTNGQRVDFQASSRGAQYVATGADPFTVQPGNTPNTTPWLETISQNGFSATVNPNGTLAVQDALVAAVIAKLGAIKGSFGQPVSSTGGALDVNVKYPASTFDPCMGPNKSNLAISVTANTRLLQGIGGARYKVCSIFLLSTSAESFSVVEGTGATCGTGTAAIIGSTTAANGPSLAANAGYAQGNGAAAIAMQNTSGNDVCLLISGSTLVAGNITYAY